MSPTIKSIGDFIGFLREFLVMIIVNLEKDA